MSTEALSLLELLVATGAPGLAASLTLEIGETSNGRLYEVRPWATRERVTLRFAEAALRHPALTGLLVLAVQSAAASLGKPTRGALSTGCKAPTAEQWCQATLDKWGAPGATVRLGPDGMEVTL